MVIIAGTTETATIAEMIAGPTMAVVGHLEDMIATDMMTVAPRAVTMTVQEKGRATENAPVTDHLFL